MRRHTGERPYPCTHAGCTKTFRESGALELHKRVHTGERPFACTHIGCGRAFKASGALSRHSKVHGVEPTPRPYPTPAMLHQLLAGGPERPPRLDELGLASGMRYAAQPCFTTGRRPGLASASPTSVAGGPAAAAPYPPPRDALRRATYGHSLLPPPLPSLPLQTIALVTMTGQPWNAPPTKWCYAEGVPVSPVPPWELCGEVAAGRHMMPSQPLQAGACTAGFFMQPPACMHCWLPTFSCPIPNPHARNYTLLPEAASAPVCRY
jgi:hypothetical protein